MDHRTAAGPAQAEALLSAAYERFDGVSARMHDVYGLRLPRHMAVFAAFVDSLGEAGRGDIFDGIGLSTGGISHYFEPGGADLIGRDGLDERLESRFRRDPAEFVTVLFGDTDGLHYGLWYDDPAELPSFVVHNYARDSAETWTDRAPTVLAQVLKRIDDVDKDLADDPDCDAPNGIPLRARLRRTAELFRDADRQACELDGVPRWAGADRPAIVGSLGPALPADAGDPRGGRQQSEQRYQGYRARSAEVLEWIADAEQELAAGQPAYALVLGQELHWVDADDYREASLRLLTGAYRALGRDALAEIAAVHHANRDLPSVSVLTGRGR